jgi:hypothetical protein
MPLRDPTRWREPTAEFLGDGGNRFEGGFFRGEQPAGNNVGEVLFSLLGKFLAHTKYRTTEGWTRLGIQVMHPVRDYRAEDIMHGIHDSNPNRSRRAFRCRLFSAASAAEEAGEGAAVAAK